MILIISVQGLNSECQTNDSSCLDINIVITYSGVEIDIIDKNIENIKELHIVKQIMKYFPTNLGKKFPSITNLHIQTSQLMKIERNNFQTIKQLNTLNLRDNELADIERETFDDLLLLEYLDLSDNKLKELDRRLFNKLTNLKTLILESNYIEEIDLNLFKNTRKLKTLSLSNNFLRKLPTYIFRNLNQMEELQLDDNDLVGLQNHLFENNKNLRKLTVANNVIQSIGKDNFELLSNLSEHNFLFNTCTHDLKPDYSIDELKLTIENNCTVDKDAEILWLNDEIVEIKRFKREDEEKLECAEIEQQRENDAIISNLTDIFNDLTNLKAQNEKLENQLLRTQTLILAEITGSKNVNRPTDELKKVSCDFYQLCYDFLKKVLTDLTEDGRQEIFTTFDEIRKAFSDGQSDISVKEFKPFFSDFQTTIEDAVSSFKARVKSNCELTISETQIFD
ncbi:CLUMA_CG016744, isoform A [Clunio marinus]|uniref:CLUMA_CG016744, isoform A n=1 Tax=Clunio marinus TaxID=568069 RepID=A0A1J1IV58_9DIPT|nr:CLUMA_CG016744, isoform A [Clunio marinus]